MALSGKAFIGILFVCLATACDSPASSDLTPVDAGRPCGELPAVICTDTGPSWELSAVACDSQLAHCPQSADGCRQATFAFDREGCLVADRKPFWYDYANCLETVFLGKRWPALAGQTITLHESCMPGPSPTACSLRPGGLGRGHRR